SRFGAQTGFPCPSGITLVRRAGAFVARTRLVSRNRPGAGLSYGLHETRKRRARGKGSSAHSRKGASRRECGSSEAHRAAADTLATHTYRIYGGGSSLRRVRCMAILDQLETPITTRSWKSKSAGRVGDKPRSARAFRLCITAFTLCDTSGFPS